MEIFDLTTRKGMQKLAKAYGVCCFPQSFLAKFAFKLIGSFMGSEATKQQSLAAEQIIQKGKENGVNEMELIVNNTKGFRLKYPAEEGMNIDTTIGSDEKMHIKVKYK